MAYSEPIFVLEFIDTDTLQIKTKSGYQVGFVCEVSMWPSDIIPADARRSVIRNVKLLDVLDYQGNPHETSIVWNTAYRCFAEEANKLRTMTIYGSRGIQTNHSNLPRLFMKGRLSIRSKAEWDGEREMTIVTREYVAYCRFNRSVQALTA